MTAPGEKRYLALIVALVACHSVHREAAVQKSPEPAQPADTGTSAAPMSTSGNHSPAADGGTHRPATEEPTNPPKPALTEWRMMGYDLASTYFNSAETILTKDNAGTLERAWIADLGGNVYGAPLQVGDTIYASSVAGVKALAADSGKELWKASLYVWGCMSYADGVLYVNTSGAHVYALNARDGKVLWDRQMDPGGDGFSSPLLVGDLVVFGGSNGGLEISTGDFRGYLVALNRMSGELVWRAYTVPADAHGASIWSSPSADAATKRVFATTGNNYGPPATDTSDAILAFDLERGDVIWKNQRVAGDTWTGRSPGPDADFGANPVLYEVSIDGVKTQLVAASNKGGSTHAVRRDDGKLVWTRTFCTGNGEGSKGIFVNTSWTGKYVLVACNESEPSTMFALDGATGDIVWMRKLDALVWGRITIANGVGFAGVGTGLEVFDVDTGKSIRRYESNGATLAGTITVANGRVAFGEGLTWSTGRAGSKLTVLALP